MRMIRLCLLVAFLAAGAAATAGGQTQPSSVPIGLALALIGSSSREGSATISVGRAPNGLPAEYIAPAPVSIVGGATGGNTRTVILAYPTGARDGVESYAQFLISKGWTRPDLPPQRGGFVSSDETNARVGWLCRDSMRVSILPAGGGPSGASWVRAMFYRDRMSGRCGTRQPTGFVQDELPFPTLLPPPGARMLSGGGGGTGMGTKSNGIRLQTSMAIPDVLAHYMGELQKAGWTIGERFTGTGFGAQVVETKSAQGDTWRGTLTVLTIGDALDLELRMAKPGF